MTPEDHIDAVLQHLAGGRVFPDVAPQGTARPFVTYQLVGGAPENYLSGDAPDKQQVRMQVNCWASQEQGRHVVSELAMLVEDAMRSATHLQVEVISGRVSTYDEDTNMCGTMQDFSMYC